MIDGYVWKLCKLIVLKKEGFNIRRELQASADGLGLIPKNAEFPTARSTSYQKYLKENLFLFDLIISTIHSIKHFDKRILVRNSPLKSKKLAATATLPPPERNFNRNLENILPTTDFTCTRCR